MAKQISMPVIRRLPRYHRFLTELESQGVERISSNQLAGIMRSTASQIRQDLNCFGGFGQQGYGYPVTPLKEEIGKILGLDQNFNAILLGAGNLGRAVANTATMPVKTMDDMSIYVNTNTADLLGITIPDSVMEKATVLGE